MTAEAKNNRYWTVFAGTYSTEEQEGIQVLRFDSEMENLHQINGRKGIANPSFLAYNDLRGLLYSVSENDEGEVAAFSVERESGALVEINRQSTKGAHPCYTSLNRNGDWLYTVNYSSGSICVYPIEADGAIGQASDHVVHEGNGPNVDRQESPHTHSIVSDPSGRFQLVADLGTDKIAIYQTGISGRLTAVGTIQSAPGVGPRHIEFHPSLPLIYVTNELNAAVDVFSFGGDKPAGVLVQTVSTVPDDFTGENTNADIHIHPSGRYLYASNRGHDSLAVYRVLEDGKLQLTKHVPTGGRSPRNFAVVPDGRHLLAANQDSDSIVVFRIGEDGIPESTGQAFPISKPVCLVVTPQSQK
jgi:6-phosphogluconolactonase